MHAEQCCLFVCLVAFLKPAHCFGYWCLGDDVIDRYADPEDNDVVVSLDDWGDVSHTGISQESDYGTEFASARANQLKSNFLKGEGLEDMIVVVIEVS
ncbi:hypothetical protein NDU88_004695 [Pleurodeles waltl]|uniref:Uncharacterized protein n=1 Tax=Pleurodeles waltl TaxID=8319 RepID=A0AAV7M872_PLEWA|nr:hypothetical protein NDU88_004695 [Pleurodeles waltl]